ncbi:MAG: flagellar biosynthesis protein FlhF [Desulforhopalus sp.]|jgi:flagellar biosynthesis protein FlhF
MQVRVFQSTDMASGLKMIRQELGPDALILSTKTVRNGKMGLLSKPLLEITAAVDTDFPGEPKNDAPKQLFSTYSNNSKKSSGSNNNNNNNNNNRSFSRIINDPVEHFLDQKEPQLLPTEHECFREFPTHKPKQSQSPDSQNEPQNVSKNDSLESEVSELKQLVKGLAGQITALSQKDTKEVAIESSESIQKKIKITNNPPTVRNRVEHIQGDHLLSLLTARGVNVETARTIAGFIRESLTEQELGDSKIISKALIETLQNLIEVNPPLFKDQKEQRRIALVGPTGVGKTTTLAKIAASYLQQHSNSIALITIDTYRIAAVEQLKVYGEIMHLPVDVVISPDQLGQALNRYQDKKLILIDTAGRSPRDSFCIDELSSFLAPEYNIEKHLVLSATTRENEIVDTMNQFSRLEIANTIFTKIDECVSLGVLLNTQLQNSNPISYITNGQRVPEDLLEITPHKIAELIMSQDQGSLHE